MRPVRFYRWLLRLYPAGFREEYQTPMERQFRDDYNDAANSRQKAIVWLRAVLDILTTAPSHLFREVARDLTYTVRAYRKRVLASALTLLALSVAMGVCTGMFAVLNGVLLRGLPFSRSEQLVEFQTPTVGAMQGRKAFQAWSASRPYVTDAVTFSTSEFNLVHASQALRVKATEASARFFKLLGVATVVGRTFGPEEDKPGAGQSVVLSHHLSLRLFGGTTDALGREVKLNGRVFTIIGVAGPGFDYPNSTDIWTPTVFDFEVVPKRGAIFFQTIGRLKPSVSLAEARQLYQTEFARAEGSSVKSEIGKNPQLLSMREQLAGPVAQALPLLSATVLLILAIACANVALLILSRTTERRQELAVRSALGASRARLIRQLTTEATALTLSASLVGLVVAHWTTQVAATVAPPSLAVQSYTVLHWRVFAFAATVAVATGIVLGALPVFLIRRFRPTASVRQTHQSTDDLATRRLRKCLVAGQAALTMSLLAGSVMVGRAFVDLLSTDLGFSPMNIVTVTSSLEGTNRRGATPEWRYYSEALQRLRAIPGVQAAGAVSHLPLSKDAAIAGAVELDSGAKAPQVIMSAATPDYFHAMGTRFVAGRDFNASEARGGSKVVIVNDAFARSTGLNSAIVGRLLLSPWSKDKYSIIGVVDTISLAGPQYPGAAQVYWPVAEEPPSALTFVVRVQGNAGEFAARCRDAVKSVDAAAAVYGVSTLRGRLSDLLAAPRFHATAVTFLAALALILAVVATYGTASYSVAQRTKEMGIRLAMGATHRRIRTMLIRETMEPLAAGLALGILGALTFGRTVAALYTPTPNALSMPCVAAAFILLAAGVLSSWKGTARVIAIHPADAVRAE